MLKQILQLCWAGMISLFISAVIFSGCSESGEKSSGSSTATTRGIKVPEFNLKAPSNVTGQQRSSSRSGNQASMANKSVSADPPRFAVVSDPENCEFIGTIGNEMFKDGFNLNKFHTRLAASYMCVADYVLKIPQDNAIPLNGKVYDAKPKDAAVDPTGVSAEKISDNKYVMKYFYRKNNATPGWYIAWEKADGIFKGKIVVNNLVAKRSLDTIDDPTKMRVDFSNTSAIKTVDIYAVFPTNNDTTKSFRLNLVHKSSEPDNTVDKIKVKSILKANKQTFVPSIERSRFVANPVFKAISIVDSLGKGAVRSKMTEVGYGDGRRGADSGYYALTFDERYYFTKTSPNEFVHKDVIDVAQKVAGNPPLCTDDADCKTKWIGWLGTSGKGDLAGNTGTEPNDDRRPIIQGITDTDYLDDTLPDNANNWDDVFDMTF